MAVVCTIIAAAALVYLTTLLASANRERDRALAAQRQSFEVMILARSLESTIHRSETALGQFVINGEAETVKDRELGYRYLDLWRRAGALLDRLERVTRSNGSQKALVAQLRQQFEARGKLLSQAALRTNYGQGVNGLALYWQANRGDAPIALSRTLDRIIAVERSRLDTRIGNATQSLARSNSVASILALFAVAMVAGAAALGFTTVQAIAQRRLARKDAEALETAVADRTIELRAANAALLAEAAERESAEAQLRQIQKMEAVGQLTGGIAHDFNNMLAVVIGGLELAKRRLRKNASEAERHLDNAMEGANRAAALTRRLLAFARSEPLLPEAVSPDQLIEGMTDLLDRTLGERIRVETRLDAAGAAIWVDRHQLENALLNLAVNARDAMDGEGTLTIASERRVLNPGEDGLARGGAYLALSVTDTGCGMDQKVKERVFEPFFTTKPPGKGTGLGLSQIFGFVRQSAGEIAIDSAPGRGTTVTLFIPRHAGDAAAIQEVDTASMPRVVASAASRATILVVEDDLRVLNATVEALDELGHKPIPCSDPGDALALLGKHPEVRLILSDVVMPGTTGPELIASLRPIHPDVGVLFVTGYAGEIDEAAAFAGYDLLRKPFTMNALASAVDAALRRPSAPPLFAAAAAAE